MLTRRLERKGYRMLTAEDGQRGIELAAEARPDLILMDMSLPVLDGWEATRALKRSADTKHIPVIALTAHAMSGDERKAYDAGCDDFDTKPVELPRLLSKIEAALDKAQ
jgi:CheY-like chemotaxis protein